MDTQMVALQTAQLVMERDLQAQKASVRVSEAQVEATTHRVEKTKVELQAVVKAQKAINARTDSNISHLTQRVAAIASVVEQLQAETETASDDGMIPQIQQPQQAAKRAIWATMIKFLADYPQHAMQVAAIGILGAPRTHTVPFACLLYTSPSPRDRQKSRMPSSA